jgi:hypothetical protein
MIGRATAPAEKSYKRKDAGTEETAGRADRATASPKNIRPTLPSARTTGRTDGRERIVAPLWWFQPVYARPNGITMDDMGRTLQPTPALPINRMKTRLRPRQAPRARWFARRRRRRLRPRLGLGHHDRGETTRKRLHDADGGRDAR